MLRCQGFPTEGAEEKTTLEKQGDICIFFYNNVMILKKANIQNSQCSSKPKTKQNTFLYRTLKIKKMVLRGEISKIKINNQRYLPIFKRKF